MSLQRTQAGVHGLKVAGFDEVQAALKGLQFRARQNTERKAARAAMQRFRTFEQQMWRSYPVKKSSVEWSKGETRTYKSGRTKRVATYSIRKQTAKAVTVKVSSKRNKLGQFVTRGSTFLNYKKKNAGAAQFAHLLDLGTKRTLPKFQMRKLYTRRVGAIAKDYIQAVKLWSIRPKATQREVKSLLD